MSVVIGFRFKVAPLYVQQIESEESAHRLHVRVNRDAFCLMTPEARLSAAKAVYGPAEATLERAGSDDFRFILEPLGAEAASRRNALAIGSGGKLRLTRAGQDC